MLPTSHPTGQQREDPPVSDGSSQQAHQAMPAILGIMPAKQSATDPISVATAPRRHAR
jgi:hypothetical protein